MNKTVLIVDDSDMVRRILNFTIKSAGYTVLMAEDGDDALLHFDGKDIDMVISDLNMPNKDGIELITEIRKMPYYRFIPVVLFVSDETINTQEMISRSAATILFDKTFIKEKMVSTVKMMIG